MNSEKTDVKKADEKVLPTFLSQYQDALPADQSQGKASRQVQSACYSYVDPEGAPSPTTRAISQELAADLGFSEGFCQSDEFVQCFVGNRPLPGMKPYATCYGGHQFGNWAGQLGDGRAINLGECADIHGRLQNFQLKGAGPTPYSRFADGYAVLRSSIREFLCSEAMHYLGIPTTRALSLISTGKDVERDMFYNGHPQMEPGAVVTRVAPSFTRFGHFEIFSARGDLHTLEKILAYTLRVDFPHLWPLYQENQKAGILAFFEEVCRLSCDMVVHWMRVGFVHGVMNTDNMSILGLTIDYGPYGWLDNFDPTWTPNTTDAQYRRYRYEQQPAIVQWNLMQLANALFPLINEVEDLSQMVRDFKDDYLGKWWQMMADKLGLSVFTESDHQLVYQLESLLEKSLVDMTLFYRAIIGLDKKEFGNAQAVAEFLSPLSYLESLNLDMIEQWTNWFDEYFARVDVDVLNVEERKKQMLATNPAFILRNYLAQMAIDKAYENDDALVQKLMAVLKKPYEVLDGYQEFYTKRPEWAENKAGCSMLSCSS